MPLSERNASKMKRIMSCRPWARRRSVSLHETRLTALASGDVSIGSPSKPVPPSQTFAFNTGSSECKARRVSTFDTMPDEIKVLILKNVLRVNRVTPMYAHVYGEKSVIRCCSQIDRRTHGIAKEIYYGDNLIVIERSTLPSTELDVRRATAAIIRVPAIPIRSWIRRLELRLAIEDLPFWQQGNTTEDEIIARQRRGLFGLLMHRDLGVLLRPKDGASRRTMWQAGLTALRDLKIVLKINDPAVCALKKMCKSFGEQMATDLRPQRVQVEIEWRAQCIVDLWANTRPYQCQCDTEGISCADVLASTIKSTVRLRP